MDTSSSLSSLFKELSASPSFSCLLSYQCFKSSSSSNRFLFPFLFPSSFSSSPQFRSSLKSLSVAPEMLSAKEKFFLGTAHPTTTPVPGLGVDLAIVEDRQQPVRPSTLTNGRATKLVQTDIEMDSDRGVAVEQGIQKDTDSSNSPKEANGGLSNLPSHQPVDMEFKNLSLTVKLGFRRGLYSP